MKIKYDFSLGRIPGIRIAVFLSLFVAFMAASCSKSPVAPPGGKDTDPRPKVELKGVLTADTVLDSTNRYMLVGDYTVPAGRTLTAQPGTTIEATGAWEIRVEGRLRIEGAASDSVKLFYSSEGDSNETSWKGLRLNRSRGENILRYARVDNALFGLFLDASDCTVKNSAFAENSIAIDAIKASQLTIESSKFKIGDVGAIVGKTGSVIKCKNSHFENGQNIGIELKDVQFELEASEFKNMNQPISIELVDNAVIKGNTFTDCTGAFMLRDSDAVNFSENRMVRCSEKVIALIDVEQSSFFLQKNSFQDCSDYFIFLENAEKTATFDATNSWWGTVDEDSVQAAIWDGADSENSGKLPIVSYKPFATQPLGATPFNEH